MHKHVEVWIPQADTDIIHQVLEPFEEEQPDNQFYSGPGCWDWYQVGGRWSGAHEPGYDINKDPAYLESCEVCNGTGSRDWTGVKVTQEWIAKMRGCNGCQGTGKSPVWPSQRKPRPLDMIKVSDLTAKLHGKLTCAELIIWRGNDQKAKVIGDGSDFNSKGLNVLKTLKKEGIKDGYLVTVDCHH